RVGGEAVLSAPRRGDEGAGMAAAREDDVARLVADPQRARDAGARHVRRVDLDDADAVGEVIHHPDLGLPGEVRARGDRHRLEADRDLRRERKPACADRVDRQAIVRRVQREEAVAARREREGPGMPALEVGERPAAGGSGGHEEQDGGESTRDHVPFLLVRAPERYQRPSAVTITPLWSGAAFPCPPGRAIEEDAAVADRTPSGHTALPLLSAPGESGRGKGRKTARHRRRGDTQSSLSDAGPLETGWARAATPGPTSRPQLGGQTGRKKGRLERETLRSPPV